MYATLPSEKEEEVHYRRDKSGRHSRQKLMGMRKEQRLMAKAVDSNAMGFVVVAVALECTT